MNYRMKQKVETGEAIDISHCQRTSDGDYILKRFEEDADYCDLTNEAWIWSIGRNLETGEVVASTLAKFYMNPKFECIWLR